MLEREAAAESHCRTDLTLLQRLRGGDTAALEILMEQHAPRVYRVAYGITQNAADAEEVVQDVFLTLFRKIHTFEERAALGSWLYRVATNAALVKRRGRRSDREVALDSLVPTFLPDGHRAGQREFLLRDWSRSPEAALLSQETREIVQSAISLLPDQYRAVLVLRDIEGLGNEEVAAIVGDSVAAVKSRLHRARMVLRETLTRFFGSSHEGGRETASRIGRTAHGTDVGAAHAGG
jgi:RNA polymerase sigma-70 factor, ECF subfamily